jgi:hypothetical protein
VSPDHQAMKKIERDFGTVLADPKCEFFGNVWVGDLGGESAKKACKGISVK